MRNTVITTAAIAALAGHASSQVIQWNSASGGSWNDVLNWTPNNVPNSTLESAVIATPGTYTVNFNLTVDPLGGLSILNPSATLAFELGRSMRLAGPMVNDGLVIINPTAAAITTELGFDAPLGSLLGTGTVRLNGFFNRARISTGAGATLDHGVDHTIEGFGSVIADMNNAGWIRANAVGNTLSIDNSNLTNSGTMIATNTGTLDVSNSSIVQTPTGLIVADGGTVLLGGTSVSGGTIDAINSGTVRLDGTMTLESVKLDGSVVLNQGNTINALASLTNNATLTINPTAAAIQTSMIFKESMSLDGSGTVVLNGFTNRSQILTDPGVTLTIPATQSIRGYGRMITDLINHADIDADVPSQSLTLDACTIDNHARLRALNNGVLDINNNVITQSASGRLVADGGSVLISNSDITGGSLDTVNSGITRFDGSVTLTGVTINGPAVLIPGLTIDAYDSMTNNGELLINASAAAVQTSLIFKESMPLGGSGTVVLNGAFNRSQILTDPDVTLTIPATQSVRGYGRIIADLVNNSTITADVASQTLTIDQSDITNNAAMLATNSATLDINNSTITQGGSGAIQANGGNLRISNTDITGGSLDTINAGSTLFDGSVTLTGVTINGPAALVPGLVIESVDSMTNNGELLINASAAAVQTSLIFKDSMALEGGGTVVLNGAFNRSQILTDPDVTLTIPATQAVRGYGRIIADLVNNSTITADVANQALVVDQSNIVNNATMLATNSAALDINNSAIAQGSGGVISADAGTLLFSGVDISGGVISADNDGVVRFDGSSSIETLTIDTNTQIIAGIALTARGTITNNATMTVNETAAGVGTSILAEGPAAFDGTGSISLRAVNVRSQINAGPGATLTQGPDHAISGVGRINVPLTNHGTIAPGNSVGTLEATAPIEFTSTAELDTEVAGNNNADLLDSSSSFHAAGTIRVTLTNGFDPAGYWGASVVTADAGVTGRFDTLVAPAPTDTRLAVRVRYLPNEIRVGAVCKPDINFDGMLNFFDISAFISLYNIQDRDADISSPFGVWNFFDIAAYISQYNTGCP